MAAADTLTIAAAAERPEPVSQIYETDEIWPAFVPHDLAAGALLDRVAAEFPQYCAVAADGDREVARHGPGSDHVAHSKPPGTGHPGRAPCAGAPRMIGVWKRPGPDS